jgi:AcrR family transcriptional regulator
MSPAATLTGDDARRAALDAANDLFYPRGIAAVTMAEIRHRSGVSLRRLYEMYPTKADLVEGWLEHRHGSWTTWFETVVGDRIEAGADVVDAIFDTLSKWLTSSDFRGCGFVNALAETAELTPAHRAVIRGHKQSLIDFLATLTPHGSALGVVVDGAIVQAAVFESTEPIEAARHAASILVRAESADIQ